MDGSENEVEKAMLEHRHIFMSEFHKNWSSHVCNVKGCGSWMICDGGLKPHRVVCAARYSGIRSYTHSKIKTVTGCTKKPAKDKQFCSDHCDGQEGPIVLAENLSVDTKKKLRKRQNPEFPQDNIFFVRSILEIKGNKFLVRWSNSSEESTWEAKSALPKFIVEWYEEDKSRIGHDLPPPIIKWSKVSKSFAMWSLDKP